MGRFLAKRSQYNSDSVMGGQQVQIAHPCKQWLIGLLLAVIKRA